MTALLATLFTLLPVCPTEDSVNCAWDAKVQGNGIGTSLIFGAPVNQPGPGAVRRP